MLEPETLESSTGDVTGNGQSAKGWVASFIQTKGVVFTGMAIIPIQITIFSISSKLTASDVRS